MRLLVFGGGGQVGTEMSRAAGDGVSVTALTRAQLDVTQRAAVIAAVIAAVESSGCDVVVNASAHTAVDKAESEPELAFAINRDGPAHMAEACARLGLPLIHISTDYVFDGSKAGAYTEEDPVNPLGVYGASKEAGERAVREALAQHVILRTAWVFAGHGKNFVRTMLRLGEDREELRVVDDQRGCPTGAADIAAAIVAIARRVADRAPGTRWDTYHFCGAEPVTWCGFARAIFDERERLTGRAPPLVHGITTAEYPTPTRRPANSVLSCAKMHADFGVAAADWRTSLRGALRELSNG